MTPLIGLLMQYAPDLIGLFAGEKAGAAAGKVSDVAKVVLGTDDASEVQAKLSADPELIKAFVEKARAELSYLMQANQAQSALALAETGKGGWWNAWRPALSWQLLFMWNWNVWIAWMVQAIAGIPVPIIPWEQLLAFSGIWLTIYGGGHTLKSVMGTK